MDNSDDKESVFLDRASRGTRGKRLTKLLDEENEEDELFWNQEALKDEEHDDNYEEEGEVADEFDSDFDEDEPEPDAEGEKEPDERGQTKKRLIPPGKIAPKKKKKTKDLSELGATLKDKTVNEKGIIHEQHGSPEGVDEEKTVRKSTRTAVVVRQAERDAIQAAIQATSRPVIKKKKEGEERRMTQEEMLLEAAQTEIMNKRHLEKVLAREEEVKKRAIVHKDVYIGPQIRFTSTKDGNYLEFKGLTFESAIPTTSGPYPQKAVCVITGLPAKYKDPKTGLPYATKEAFQIIRERYCDDTNRKELHKGTLHDTLSSLGFSRRRKRSDLTGRERRNIPGQWSNSSQVSTSESPSESLSLSSD